MTTDNIMLTLRAICLVVMMTLNDLGSHSSVPIILITELGSNWYHLTSLLFRVSAFNPAISTV